MLNTAATRMGRSTLDVKTCRAEAGSAAAAHGVPVRADWNANVGTHGSHSTAPAATARATRRRAVRSAACVVVNDDTPSTRRAATTR